MSLETSQLSRAELAQLYASRSGGTYPGVPLEAYRTSEEQSLVFLAELNKHIDEVRQFVTTEYGGPTERDEVVILPGSEHRLIKKGSSVLPAPPRETGWKFKPNNGVFVPEYDQNVTIRGQEIKTQDTIMQVTQYLEGSLPHLGRVHNEGWSGVETMFGFSLLVREEGSWYRQKEPHTLRIPQKKTVYRAA